MSTTAIKLSKCLMIALLVIILIAIINVRLSNTPTATKANKVKEGFSNLEGISDQPRDLSTPSSRLVGRWKNFDYSGEVYYSPTDPALRIGSLRFRNESHGSFGCPIRFKIISEEASGTQLVIRRFRDVSQINATTGLDFSESDALCTISKDGLWMSEEYTTLGRRWLIIYRYVDDKITP